MSLLIARRYARDRMNAAGLRLLQTEREIKYDEDEEDESSGESDGKKEEFNRVEGSVIEMTAVEGDEGVLARDISAIQERMQRIGEMNRELKKKLTEFVRVTDRLYKPKVDNLFKLLALKQDLDLLRFAKTEYGYLEEVGKTGLCPRC